MVLGARLELASLAAQDFKSCVYTIPPPEQIFSAKLRSKNCYRVVALCGLLPPAKISYSLFAHPSKFSQQSFDQKTEAVAGIAPAYKGFADPCLATWLHGRLYQNSYYDTKKPVLAIRRVLYR